jgi:ribonucleoside-triphosphate reductase (thioredoxin)
MSLLSQEFLDKYDNKDAKFGFNGLGYTVYKRTYSRVMEDGKLEEWKDTLTRCINGAQAIGAGYTTEEAERLFDHMFNLRALLGGRMLWQLGTKTVEQYGANSLLNCAFVAIRKYDDFCFIFDNLMLGCGLGFSVRRQDINELPRVKKNVTITHEVTKDADFIIPDSRVGWTELLRKVLKSYFVTGKSFSYSTILIRGAGEKITGFGGKASGPLPLVNGVSQICEILKDRAGKKLRSIDVLDIANILGSIVVAGNVRRSAEVALGDADDVLFLRAKRWDLGNIPNWRAMSNNTIYADTFDYTSQEFWDLYNGNAEPYGLFNLSLTQTQGRLGEYRNDPAEGSNPCLEISLESKEFCNLSELVLPNITSEDQLKDCIYLLYKTQKAITQMQYIDPESTKVVNRNARIGMGVTGIYQAVDKLNWLDAGYRYLREVDAEYSRARGWNESIKVTTLKPSGSLSLVAGVTPGIHPAYAQYYIRRVSLSSNDPLVEYCKDLGYTTEYRMQFDGTLDRSTVLVQFPCKMPEGTVIADNLSAVEHLEMIKRLQTIWVDNSISATVYYKPHELDEIKEWLSLHYADSIKAVSFLRHSEHNFQQAPYEPITSQEYELMISVITSGNYTEASGLIDDLECSTGVCPVR